MGIKDLKLVLLAILLDIKHINISLSNTLYNYHALALMVFVFFNIRNVFMSETFTSTW